MPHAAFATIDHVQCATSTSLAPLQRQCSSLPVPHYECYNKIPAMNGADEQPFTTPTHPPGSRATGHSRGAHGDQTDDFLQNRHPVTQASMGSRLPLKSDSSSTLITMKVVWTSPFPFLCPPSWCRTSLSLHAQR